MDNEILEKIKKCLALAKSDNPNEAATALRQAQALMEKHGITSEALELSDVEAYCVAAGAGKTPPRWILLLTSLIQRAFGVDAVFSAKQVDWSTWQSDVEFVGVNGSSEIAGYAYAVLLRQLKKGRADYLKTLNKRLKPLTKTRRGDLYAEGWVQSAGAKINAQQQSDSEKALISRWKANKYGNLNKATGIDRTKKSTAYDNNAYRQGRSDGEKVQFHQGVKTEKRQRIGGVSV